MGMNNRNAACCAGQFLGYIPTDTALASARYRKCEGIVIPVVVGSSPISHPSIHAARSPSARIFIQRQIPTVGILA